MSELITDYTEPCARCSERQWGITEGGQFYCINCHSIIERTREAPAVSVPGLGRVTKLSSGPKVKRAEGGRQWSVCEGFQFIVRSQAEALIRLGVDPSFKNEVLVHLWRLYLQKTHHAYTDDPIHSTTFRLVQGAHGSSDTDFTSGSGLGSESGPDSVWSSYESEGGFRTGSMAGSTTRSRTGSTAGSSAGSGLSDWSQGSLDSESYVGKTKKKRSRPGQMSMRKTLAFLHVALTWSRQPLTLCQLLRLVDQGQVPYINSYECFPEEMKLSNRDALIFRVQSVPSYLSIHQESERLIKFLRLPAFPPICFKSSIHPLNISLRLLIDLNLPDDMVMWVESVLNECDLMSASHLTFDPSVRPKLPHYDLIAAAAIVITMKKLFGFDDSSEWALSSSFSPDDTGLTRIKPLNPLLLLFHENHLTLSCSDVFSVRRWYRLLQKTLRRHERREWHRKARRQWIPKKPFYFTYKEKIVNTKRRRVFEQLTSCFKRLSDRHSNEWGRACSFRFLWGQELDADGQRMHHLKLTGGARMQDCFPHDNYWHLTNHRFSLESVKDSLPASFLWLLRLVSFMLNVQSNLLFKTVLKLERKLLKSRRSPPRPSLLQEPPKPKCTARPRKTKTKIKTKTKSRQDLGSSSSSCSRD